MLKDFDPFSQKLEEPLCRLSKTLSDMDSYIDFYVNKIFKPHYNLLKFHHEIIKLTDFRKRNKC